MESMPLEELRQIHDHVKNILIAYVTWFAFFLVLLLGAMGWSVKMSIEDGKFARPVPYVAMLVLFAVQLVFSIFATGAIRGDLEIMDSRLTSLALHIAGDGSNSYSPAAQIPRSIHQSFFWMQMTLVFNLGFWILVLVMLLVFRKRPMFSRNETPL